MANEIHVGDIGTDFRVTINDAGTAVNLTGATITYIFKKPDRTTFTRSGTIVTAASGICQWITTAASDLDTAGEWDLQLQVSFSASQVWKTETYAFEVHANL